MKQPMPTTEIKVAASAEISPGAQLGPGCEIGPWSVVGPEVQLGPGCRLKSRVRLTGKVTAGENNIFQSGVIIGAREGEDQPGSSERGQVKIGANNVFREYTIIYSSSREYGQRKQHLREKQTEIKQTEEKAPVTIIGDNNFLMAYTVIKAGARLKDNINIANATVVGDEAEIDSGAFLGGLCQLGPGVKQGRLSMLGGHSYQRDDLPPFLLADGNPAALRGLNVIALRRAGYQHSDLKDLKNIYRQLYRSEEEGKLRQSQLESLKDKDFPEPETALGEELLVFLRRDKDE